MSTLTIPATALGQLRKGDTITSIDGHTLARPLSVRAPLTDGRSGIVAPKGSKVEHWIYPDSQIGNEVTYEAAPPKEPKPRRRVIAGVPLVGGDGDYHTEDGHFWIQHGEFATTCDEPHPIRWEKDRFTYTWDGKLVRGEQCPGGQEHWVLAWFVYEIREIGTVREYAEKLDAYDTLREAAKSLPAFEDLNQKHG